MRILCITVGCFLLFNAQAQSVRFGATTAYNATFVLDKGLAEDPRYSSNYTYNLAPIGFNFGVDVSRKFGLQLESILSNQGQIYQLVNTAKRAAGERRIDLQYLQLPLMMKFMSGGTGAVRSNFNFGPQMSILTKAVETIQANAGNSFAIPAGLTLADIQQDFPTATLNPDGTYSVPANTTKDVLTKEANDFKNTEFSLAAAFGLDFDLSRHLMLSMQVRANYSLTDMRNGDVINTIKSGNASDIFGSRANLLVGVQMGLHYSLGVLRSRKD